MFTGIAALCLAIMGGVWTTVKQGLHNEARQSTQCKIAALFSQLAHNSGIDLVGVVDEEESPSFEEDVDELEPSNRMQTAILSIMSFDELSVRHSGHLEL